MPFNLPPGCTLLDIEGPQVECAECDNIGPVDIDGLCEECSERAESNNDTNEQ